jgi:hypothetical protein
VVTAECVKEAERLDGEVDLFDKRPESKTNVVAFCV